MDLGIAGRTALVLGGSKGIGRQIALDFADNGVNTIIVARGQEAIDDTVAAGRAKGAKVIGISEDLLDLDAYARIQARAVAELAAPDIAIYNLDPPPPGTFADVDEELLAQAYHSVVLCYARMLRTVLPHMQEQGWGRIVTIGSGTAKQLVRSGLNFGYVLANTTRVSASALMKTVAGEVAQNGVTLNTIGTGYIDTEANRSWTHEQAEAADMSFDDFRGNMVQHIPVGRAGAPGEMASLCLYLCSQGAGFTTGETILCDGGQTNSIL